MNAAQCTVNRRFGVDCVRQAEAVDKIVLDGDGGRTLTLGRLMSRDDESFWSYEATLTIAEGRVKSAVHDHGDGLAKFFDEVASAWTGFDGTKEYASLEGQLELSCTHDGRGAVECRVVLRQPWPPAWRAEAVLQFGAGAHLERLASEVRAFVDAAAAAPDQRR